MKNVKPYHMQDLQRSGLSDETIAELGIRSVDDVEAFDIVGVNCGPALAFPYQGTDFTRLKPDKPFAFSKADSANSKVKSAKYLSPKGAANRLYVPPIVRPVLADSSQRLLITEGEKKAAKATQEGFPTVGMVGIWGFRDREHQLIPDLANGIVWKGREVFLVPDNDVATNSSVRSAVWELGWQFRQLGAIVRVVVMGSDNRVS